MRERSRVLEPGVIAGLLLALLVGLAEPSGGMRRVQAQGGWEDDGSVFLPAPRPVRQRLSRAEAALRDGRFSDMIMELAAVLNDVDALDGVAQDYFYAPDGDTSALRSVKAQAQQLLGSLPPRGRELYELQFGGDARALLDEALASGNLEQLTEITRQLFHTQAGYEATMLLGRVELNQGRPLAAALCFQRLADSPAAAVAFEPELSLLLATSWLYAGMPERAEAALEQLERRDPQARLRIGDDQVVLAGDDRSLEWLEALVGRPSDERPVPPHQWVLHRGNPQRNASGLGGMPLARFRWRVPTVDDPSDEREIRAAAQQFVAQDEGVIPSLQPLVVGDMVLMRTPEGLLGIDLATGKRLWEFPWYHRASDPGRDGELAELRQLQLVQRLWRDAAYGQVSSDGRFVYLLDELGYAGGHGSDVNIMIGGVPRFNEDYPRSHNKLVSLEVASEGKLRWMVGGETGEDEPRLAGVFFLGPPLPLQDQLYVIGELNAEIRLYVLDARSGRLEWSQQLAHVDARTISADPGRRLAGAIPSYADGVLICPTSAGAVVAVDVASRSLLWGFQYMTFRPAGHHFGVRQRRMSAAQWGERWADATATIADGRVILTPAEADELHCLDLLTGEPAWPARPRGDLLYVAGVYRGQLILVGKNRLVAWDLADGRPRWERPLDKDGMVSGRGVRSGGHYYLPTTEAKLLEFDLADGRILQRTHTGEVLGNLVGCRDQLVSQGPESLAAYYLVEPLREQVAARLADDPDDADALARLAELQLHDEQPSEAVATLRRAHRLQPDDDATRVLLVATLLDALRDDFDANRSTAREVERLIDQPDQRLEFLRLMASGLDAAGEWEQALDAYLQLVDADMELAARYGTASRGLEAVDAVHQVRRDRWLQARIGQLTAAAEGAQREYIDRMVAGRLDEARRQSSTAGLHTFLRYFGAHPAADEARLELARRLRQGRDLVEAQLLLTQVGRSPDDRLRKQAARDMLDVLRQARRYEAVAHLTLEIARQWPDEPVDGDRAGRELLERARLDPALAGKLTAPDGWPAGEVEVEETGDQLDRRNAYQRLRPVDFDAIQGPLPPDTQLLFDQRNDGTLLLRDGYGHTWHRLSLTRSTGGRINHPQLLQARANGHLIVLFVDGELLALDVLHGSSDPILWRTDVGRGGPGRPTSIRTRSTTNAWGESRVVPIDARQNPIGIVGPLNEHGVAFVRQRELVALHPATGEPVWVRSDVAPGSYLFGDGQLLCLVTPDDRELQLIDPIDGTVIGQRKLPAGLERWATWGRNLLSWRQQPGMREVTLHDAWSDETLYRETFPDGTRARILDADEVALLEPDGRFRVVSLRDGQVVVDTTLDAEREIGSLTVLRSRDSYVVAVSRNQRGGSEYQGAPDHALPLVRGPVYLIDRHTGEPRWQSPAHVDEFALPPDQPRELPVIVFMRQRSTGQQNQVRCSVLCLDKRDGRAVLLREDVRLNLTLFAYELVGDPQQQSIALRLPEKTFTLRFTPAPVPPAPPAQLGEFSSLNTVPSRVGRLTDSLLRSFGLTPEAEADEQAAAESEPNPRDPP